MATTQDPPEGIAAIGKEIAADVQELVRAEIGVAMAHVRGLIGRFAVGAGLAVGALLMALLWVIFTVATLDEGVQALDSWPLYAAVGGVLVAAGGFMLATALPRWISWLPAIAGVFGVIATVVGFVLFYVLTIIGSGDEIARRGWAISAAVFFGLTVAMGGGAALMIRSGVGAISSTVGDIKEEAEWVKQLTRRNASGS